MLDIFHEIGQTLKNNKLRTGLTGFAVAWGIFMLIILLGLARGVFNAFDDFASSDNSNVIHVSNGVTAKPYRGYNEGRRITLKGTDLDLLTESGGRYISDAISIKYIDTARVSTRRDYVTEGLSGVFPKAEKLYGVRLIKGRFINQADIDSRRKVMLLPKRYAATLFNTPEEAVGQRVDALGLSWNVIGIFDTKWGSGDIYIPFTTAVAMAGDDKLYSIRVSIDNVSTMDDGLAAEQEIRHTLASPHSFAPDDEGAVRTWNSFTNFLSTRSALGIVDISIWIIGIFTLLSGIVGVSNIMFVSVKERTHEIGIRRAIGARPRDILSQIVLESVAITTLFGYIGIVTGMIVMQIVASAIGDSDGFKNPTVDLSIAVKVTITLIVAGALAGLFPAIKATKVKPVEALRDE